MELLPRDQIAFQQMLDTIRRNFERFGFLPIETPVMELSEVLLTKSGGETERQVYFVQSTGAIEQGSAPEMAMRFDLTVPLARYVAEHEHELSFPFRRYQMQRVYRGERAQRGRFREFYQCDIDVIGKDALSVRFDAELPAVIHAVFSELAIGDFTIRINNRKVLKGVMSALNLADAELQAMALREVDKIDKIGMAQLQENLVARGIERADAAKLADVLVVNCSAAVRAESVALGLDPNRESISRLRAVVGHDALANEGLRELEAVLDTIAMLGIPASAIAVDFSIARGLDYYTGTVYETTLNAYPQIGSICSGGRYENLAGHYSKSHLPGVGISIGLTRLFWQLREAGLVSTADSCVDVLVSQMDEKRLPLYLDIASQLRAAGINTEVQLESKKLAKQFQYADRAGIRFVVVVGDDEEARNEVTVKDLRRQEQFTIARADLVNTIRVEREQARAMPKPERLA